MQVAVIGAGAIGSVLAVALAEVGHDVVLGGRRAAPEVVVVGSDGVPRVPVLRPVTEPPPGVIADCLLVVTKAHDTRGVRSWLDAMVGNDSTVVLMQNGVDHRERLAGLVPDVQVLPALAYVNAERRADGAVVHHWGDALVVPDEPRAAAFAQLLRRTRLRVRVEPDFRTAAWRKLLTNAATSPITALTLRHGDVFALPDVRRLATDILRETVAAGCAVGARLDESDVAATIQLYDGLLRDSGSSMLFDREAGRPMEHEFLTGAVVRTADAHDIPVPLNRAMLALLRGLDVIRVAAES